MPVEGVKLKNDFKLPEAAAAAHKSVAPHIESTLKSAGSKSDDSFDCLACVKYYASAALDGICSICAFIYNLLFGSKVTPEKKAEEKPKAEEAPAPKEAASKKEDKPIAPTTTLDTGHVEQPSSQPAKKQDDSYSNQVMIDQFAKDKETVLEMLREADAVVAPYAVRNFITFITQSPATTQSYIDKTKLNDLFVMADNVKRKQEGAKEKLIKAIEALPSPYDFLNMQAADAAPEKKA